MAPVTPPVWEQAGSFSAKAARQGIACLLQPEVSAGALVARGGVHPRGGTNSLQVSQRATPDMNVTIAPGTCHIAATSITGGVYACVNDAAYDVAISAAHATLARKDLIFAQVRDAVDDSGSNNDFIIDKATGTPASSPTRPATPGQAIALAEVLVPANSTSVTNGNITDLRRKTVALGGILPCANSGEVPSSPYAGMKIFRTDTKQEQVWDGTAWQTIISNSDTGWQTLSLNGPNNNAWTANTVCHARKLNGFVHVRLALQRWSTSALSVTDDNGSIPIVLPAGYIPPVTDEVTMGFWGHQSALIRCETGSGNVRILAIGVNVDTSRTVYASIHYPV